MVDPISLTAVLGMLGAVGSGMANEAGKRAYEMIGGLATRITGRQVTPPADTASREALARLLLSAASRDPRHAGALSELEALVHSALAAPRPRAVTPLPAGIHHFTDRVTVLKALSKEADRRPDGRPRRVLLHGPEGIGTSAVAKQWAGRHQTLFPDRGLYADLRGDTPGRGRDVAVVLRLLLRDLGLHPDDIPPAVDERAALFARLLAELRLVLVLDHAQSAAQVTPLLVGAPGVFTIVVARRPLPGVDAVLVPVGPLADRDARKLLTDIAGKERIAAARATLPAVLERCAGSPYALRAAAAALLEAGGRPPAALGARTPGQDTVGGLAAAVYATLPPETARCYRLWALRPWPALGPALAAKLAGLAEPAAAGRLADLAEVGLIDAVDPAADPLRYRYRAGVREHAAALAASEDGIAACATAVRAGIEHCLDFAVHADRAALPQRWPVGPRNHEARADRYPGPGAALAALGPELGNLVQAGLAADEFQDHAIVPQLAEAVWAVQLKAGRHDEVLPLLRAAVRVTEEHFPGTRAAGRAHVQLAFALKELRRFEEAERLLARAAEAERTAGHLRGLATAVESLGLLRLDQWRWSEAREQFNAAVTALGGIAEGDEGYADVPRALALLHRHLGRALRGLDLTAQAREEFATALRYFRATGADGTVNDPYNAARTLTDLAETDLQDGDPAAALGPIRQALDTLGAERADHHVRHLLALRSQCERAAAG